MRPSAKLGVEIKHGAMASGGFSLVELMVSIAVLSLLMAMILTMTSQTSKAWSSSVGKIKEFESARAGYESMRRKLKQATLNTYWDYDSATTPTRYLRQSDLQFASGPWGKLFGSADARHPSHAVFFQAPLGYSQNTSYQNLGNLMNACGYFVEFGDDSASRPAFGNAASARFRYRLMEAWQPSENFELYSTDVHSNPGFWFRTATSLSAQLKARPIAENIIALIVWPKKPALEDKEGDDLTSDFYYDSTLNASVDPQPLTANQLPPMMEVIMVAIDEPSAIRLALASGTNPPDLGLTGLFDSVSQFDTHMGILEGKLRDARVNYRIFRTSISLPGARWSNN